MFSGRDSGLLDFLVEGLFEVAPGAGEWRAGGDLVGEVGVQFGEGGVDDPGVGLGEEEGDPSALVGQLVALAFGDPVDEAFAAYSSQVVGRLAGAVAGDQAGDELAQAAVGQPVEEVPVVA